MVRSLEGRGREFCRLWRPGTALVDAAVERLVPAPSTLMPIVVCGLTPTSPSATLVDDQEGLRRQAAWGQPYAQSAVFRDCSVRQAVLEETFEPL